ncbi:hypothetical protein CU669_00315 [Paramagnetospirillum kuznetsovii]|uniref:Uncharacterized protein n=1 Tax=Paramagnetospirillum kuznetsovii TaxID=2053833 RepID=A0A364P342_9PROT|nr:hypothetical protein [Paramagnetospirillum kuznetsovii]RAU23587.1 hypothetical protein CU669_00315 [Paramagnetospirillum kuznetsovii]
MFEQLLTAIYWVGFVAFLAIRWRRGLHMEMSRRDVVILGLVCVIFGNFELWIAGRDSFLLKEAELDFSFPLYEAFVRNPAGASFIHGFGGGIDMDAATIMTGRLVSLEAWLRTTFPVGGAQFIYINSHLALSFIGIYRLCRGFPRLDRSTAAAAAAYFALSMEPAPWSLGLGLGMAPLVCHLVVGRLGRSHYWPGVLAMAAFHAISSTPSHSVLGLVPALFLVAMLRSWRSLLQALPGIMVVVAFVVANSHEGIFAKIAMGPYSARGNELSAITRPQLAGTRLWMAAAACALALWGQRALGLRVLIMLATALSGPSLLLYLAYSIPGLAALKVISASGMLSRLEVPLLLALGMGASAAQTRAAGDGRLLRHAVPVVAATLAAMAAGWFLHNRAFNAVVWLNQGGLGIYHAALTQLTDPPWLPKQPVRTVSTSYRLSPNIAAAAGLDTFDAVVNLSPRAHHEYWRHVAAPAHVYTSHPSLFFVDVDFRCCASYDFPGFADTTLLRIANVGYVLSVVPLEGANIVQVAGPVGPPDDLPRSTQGIAQRIGRLLRLFVHPAVIRVYSIGDPLPRVYAAKGLIRAPVGTDETEFYSLIRRHGLDRTPVVLAQDVPVGTIPAGIPQLGEWRLQADMVAVEVASGGGLVVFNSSWLPFWHAYADGSPTDLFAVNGAQMAAVVPPGTKRLEFRYERPRLRTVLAARLGF